VRCLITVGPGESECVGVSDGQSMRRWLKDPHDQNDQDEGYGQIAYQNGG
jgi:hypothetical protein